MVASVSQIQEKFDRARGGTDNLPVARHFAVRSFDLMKILRHTSQARISLIDRNGMQHGDTANRQDAGDGCSRAGE